MSKIVFAQGTKLELSTTDYDKSIALDSTIVDGATFVELNDISKGFTLEGIDTDEIEVTTLAALKFKEYAQGLSDPGSISGDTHYKMGNAEQVALDAAFESGGYRIVRVTFVDGSEFAQYGFVKGQPININLNEYLASSISIRLSGAPVKTPAA